MTTQQLLYTDLTTQHVLYSRRQTANLLDLHYSSIDKAHKSGLLRATRIGRRVLFAMADIEAFVKKARAAR